MSHEGYHEDVGLLSEETKNLHRALVSLQEELEAVDWYQQRADVCQDPALKAVLLHNRNEEVEHAMMVLEWIRRRDPKVDQFARTYLFTQADITEIEEALDVEGAAEKTGGAPGAGATPPSRAAGGCLSIGSLKSLETT
jgi:ferritin-like protein